MNFEQKIEAAVDRNNSLVCVGLDTVPDKIPEGVDDILSFNMAIIDATKDLVCAYKPNSAFYEASEQIGYQALKGTCEYIKETAPGIPIIFDYKRGDIGNTNSGYIKSAFDNLNADAVTINPYMGRESLQPYLDVEDKGIIVLCRTSNPGAGEFQDLHVEDKKLYQVVAEHVSQEWNQNGNCALVAGATNPEDVAKIREIVGDDMLLLVPGIGAQGGEVEKTVRAGVNKNGRGIIVNSSRGIIYASNGPDFAEAARKATISLRDEINKYRQENKLDIKNTKEEIALGLHEIGALKFGKFTLKSGLESPMYMDLRLFISHPEFLKKIAKVYAQLLKPLKYDRLAGVAYAALPIAGAVSLETNEPWIYMRKEGLAKSYGLKKSIEGEFEEGETIVVLDDLVTKGDSKIEVIEPFTDQGLTIKDFVVLIDYEKGAKELLQEKGYNLHSFLTTREVVEIMKKHDKIDDSKYRQCLEFLNS